jgi:hypothetical protein
MKDESQRKKVPDGIGKILKLDESCIGNPKVETLNWTTTPQGLQSNLRFPLSGFQCGIRPISDLGV